MSTLLEVLVASPGSPWSGLVARLSTIFTLAVCAVGAHVVANAIYNLYFHPYAKYPGPFLAKITDLYAGYHAWRGDIHLDMWRCHEKYGDKVRYAPNRLNVNTATALKNIYTEGQPFTKSKNYSTLIHKAPNSLTVRDRKDHGRRRRVIQQGLADATLRAFYPEMFVLIDRFCNRLLRTTEEVGTFESDQAHVQASNAWTHGRNMGEFCNWLAFDFMASFIFSGNYNMLERQQYRYVSKVIGASNVRTSAILQAPVLKLCRLDRLLFPQAIAARNIFLGFVHKLLRDTRRAAASAAVGEAEGQQDKEQQRTDLFTMLSHATDPVTGRGFTPEEMIAESVTLVVAGGDTSAAAMASVFFYLSRNPNTYSCARDEVRSTFACAGDIAADTCTPDGLAGGSTSKLMSCRYLRACIDEAMRMSPSVGQSLSREVPAGGVVVDGDFIPAGCDVGVPIYSIHHNAKYFPDPFDYHPERWLVDRTAGALDATHQQQIAEQYDAYNPFSVGPRSCMGKGVALVQMMATFATVLHRLEFKMSAHDVSGGRPGSEEGRHRTNEFQLKDHITSATNGPTLRFRGST